MAYSRHTLGVFLGGGLVAAVLAAGPAVAQSEVADETTGAPAELDPETRAFIIGNAIFVVFHEFGHVLIRDFDVPILGLEENSADTLAAITLILADRAEPEREPRLSEFLAMSALGNILLWQTGLEKSNEEVLYWATHDVSIRRAARTLCLLYGSDTEEFGWVAGAVDMAELRADWCEDEFDIAARAVNWVLETYGVPEGGASKTTADQITIRYRRPRNDQQQFIMERLQEWRVIENVVDFMSERFVLPDEAKVVVRDCGSPNAYWDPDYRELIFCYDLLEGLRKLGDAPQVQQLAARFEAARE
jgi:hypothetical protein